ncbi:hypothetical protein SUGI_0667610 [Cryptomeria japonica]|nr:hypothetical protein SUGI_0667610 [Cryptomeria japonica]
MAWNDAKLIGIMFAVLQTSEKGGLCAHRWQYSLTWFFAGTYKNSCAETASIFWFLSVNTLQPQRVVCQAVR